MPRRVTVNIDSFPIVVHGQQPGAAYNGHYRETVYHPLVASYSVAGKYDSMQDGHRLGNGFVHAILRQGQVHTAQGMKRFLQQTLQKARGLGQVLDFRIDAGYTDGGTLDYLTDEKLRFIGRLRSNPVLDRLAEPHLKRPVGRPPKEGYEDVIELGMHRAASWKHPQRLLLVIVDRPDPKTGQLNLLPDYFFLVVGWKLDELDGPAASSTTVSEARSRIASASSSKPSGRTFRTTTSRPMKPCYGCRCWPSTWRRCCGSSTKRRPAVASIWGAFNATC